MTLIKKYIQFLREEEIREGPRMGARDINSVNMADFLFGSEYEFITLLDFASERRPDTYKILRKELSDKLGVSISDTIDRTVSQKTATTEYRLTYDDSVKYLGPKTGKDVRGIEFVTPPVEWDTFIKNTKNVFKYIQDRGFQTNGTTGLHVGISFKDPEKNNKIDPLKLILLSGEGFLKRVWPRVQYAHDNGNLSSDYVKSNVQTVKKILKQLVFYSDKLDDLDSSDLPGLIQGWLDEHYKSFIRFGNPEWREKHHVINIGRLADGYVEFRVIGGENYHLKPDEVFLNVRKFALTLQRSASDTNRREYLKKIYKIFDQIMNDLLVYSDVTGQEEPVSIKNTQALTVLKKADVIFHKNLKLKEHIYNIAHYLESKSESGIYMLINLLNEPVIKLDYKVLLRNTLINLIKIYNVKRNDIKEIYDQSFFEPGKIPPKPEDETEDSDYWDWADGTKREHKFSLNQIYKIFGV